MMNGQDRSKIVSKLFERIVRRVMGTITHVSTRDAVIALTFDDGPHPEFTSRLLKILNKHQAYATFFMIGEIAQCYPEIVRGVAQAGHTIGNHSWDHPSFPLVTPGERKTQIRACAAALAPYGQQIFRPPYGHQSIASRFDALLLGYQVVTWNVVAHDWLDHDPRWMVNEIKEQIKPGSIILLHDGLWDAMDEKYFDREPMLDMVDMLLEQLSAHFRFVTVPELFRCGRPQQRNWRMKGDLEFLNSLQRKRGETRRYIRSFG